MEFETIFWLIVAVFCGRLKFTPLEFETNIRLCKIAQSWVKIYSVGVWNDIVLFHQNSLRVLKFTPLEFETISKEKRDKEMKIVKIYSVGVWNYKSKRKLWWDKKHVKIYSVGVWNSFISENKSINQELKFTPLEFETLQFCVD